VFLVPLAHFGLLTTLYPPHIFHPHMSVPF
jgi:hypothetical protein